MADETDKGREEKAREEKAREEATRTETERRGDAPPPAGPHDRPDLINPDATPGTGVLPSPDDKKGDTDPAAG